MTCVACICNQIPCVCGASAPPGYAGCEKRVVTKCDRDTTNNVWVEKPDGEDVPGVCMLDTMDTEGIANVIARNDRARMDLMRVTSDPALQELARTVPRLTPTYEEEKIQQALDSARRANMSPFYSIFRGQRQ